MSCAIFCAFNVKKLDKMSNANIISRKPQAASRKPQAASRKPPPDAPSFSRAVALPPCGGESSLRLGNSPTVAGRSPKRRGVPDSCRRIPRRPQHNPAKGDAMNPRHDYIPRPEPGYFCLRIGHSGLKGAWSKIYSAIVSREGAYPCAGSKLTPFRGAAEFRRRASQSPRQRKFHDIR
jgi:hypothetical protein